MVVTEEEKVKVDAIIVGGGPAGLACAIKLAKEGLDAIVVERGEYCGSKNMGGLVYGNALDELIPAFWEKAPFERPVSRRCFSYLGETDHFSFSFGSQNWSRPPYNNTFIVHRSQFDRWMAGEAEQAGASLLEGMLVDDLIYEGDDLRRRAVGVKIRDDENFYADVIIIAEGANALLTKKVKKELNLPSGKAEQEYGVGVKEIIGLPKEAIEDRFLISGGEGVALDFFGGPFEKVVGGGFIYTAKEALHVGVVARSDSLCKVKTNPNDLMDRFKSHPRIKPYLKGGELLEYSAHLVPESGFHAVGALSGNGVLLAGDCAGLVNMSLYKEGTNLAMYSGIFAAETVISAKEKGDFSGAALKEYETRLHKSTVMKDLEAYRDVPRVFDSCPDVFSTYPEKFAKMITDYFRVSQKPKRQIQKQAHKDFFKAVSKWKLIKDLYQAKKLC